jgi:hypothetical protein
MGFGIIIIIIILGVIVMGCVILKIGLPDLFPTPVETLEDAKKNNVTIPAHQPPIESNTPDANTQVQQQHNIPGTGYSEWANFLADPLYVNPILFNTNTDQRQNILLISMLSEVGKIPPKSISSAINLCNITSNCIGVLKVKQHGTIFESSVTGAINPNLLRDTFPQDQITAGPGDTSGIGKNLSAIFNKEIEDTFANNPHSVLLKNSKINGIVGLPEPTNQYDN